MAARSIEKPINTITTLSKGPKDEVLTRVLRTANRSEPHQLLSEGKLQIKARLD